MQSHREPSRKQLRAFFARLDRDPKFRRYVTSGKGQNKVIKQLNYYRDPLDLANVVYGKKPLWLANELTDIDDRAAASFTKTLKKQAQRYKLKQLKVRPQIPFLHDEKRYVANYKNFDQPPPAETELIYYKDPKQAAAAKRLQALLNDWHSKKQYINDPEKHREVGLLLGYPKEDVAHFVSGMKKSIQEEAKDSIPADQQKQYIKTLSKHFPSAKHLFKQQQKVGGTIVERPLYKKLIKAKRITSVDKSTFAIKGSDFPLPRGRYTIITASPRHFLVKRLKEHNNNSYSK